MTTPWTDKEYKALGKLIPKCRNYQEVAANHNKKWKTGRSPDAIRDKLVREGVLRPQSLLATDLPTRRKSDIPVPKLAKSMKDYLGRHKDGVLMEEICDYLELPPKRVKEIIKTARGMGWDVGMVQEGCVTLQQGFPEVDRLAVSRLPIEPVKDEIVFAAISDPHFASRLQRQECLKDFINLAYHDFKVRRVMVSGDILAGRKMYPGQENEVFTEEGDRQVNYAVEGFPKHKGLTYDIIGGNHDAAFYKQGGFQATRILGERRSDIKNHGWYTALLDLHVPGKQAAIKVDIYHPDKAGAYALTYHVQNAIRDIPPGMKPDILLCGHEHRMVCLEERNIMAFLLGCFEDQTLYLKRKHRAPVIGGWILKVGVCKDGSPRSFSMQWIKYFHSRRGYLRGTRPGTSGDEEVRLNRSLGWPRGA